MAHECPDCGYTCHCLGDIDDCVMNLDGDVDNCIHCPIYGEDTDELRQRGRMVMDHMNGIHIFPNNDFALKVREVILDYRGGYISAEEAVTKISYEYVEKVGELE